MATKMILFLLLFATAISIQKLYIAGSPIVTSEKHNIGGTQSESVEEETTSSKGAGKEKVSGETTGKEGGSHFIKSVSEMVESGKESLEEGEFGKAVSEMVEISSFVKEYLEKGEFDKAVSEMVESSPFGKEYLEKADFTKTVSEMMKNSPLNKESLEKGIQLVLTFFFKMFSEATIQMMKNTLMGNLGGGDFGKAISNMMAMSSFGKVPFGEGVFGKMMPLNPLGAGQFGKMMAMNPLGAGQFGKMMPMKPLGAGQFGKMMPMNPLGAGQLGKMMGSSLFGKGEKKEDGSIFGVGKNLPAGIPNAVPNVPLQLG